MPNAIAIQLPQVIPAPTVNKLRYASLRNACAVYEMGSRTIRRNNPIMTMEGSNPKLSIESDTYETLSLSLAPADSSGIDICPLRSEACTNGCLGHNSGHSVMGSNCSNNRHAVSPVRLARIKRTRELFGGFGEEASLAAVQSIDQEIAAFVRRCRKNNKKPVVRMNAFSDIVWESYWPALFARYSMVQFYDYTKIVDRFDDREGYRELPANYHLTFSRSEDNEYNAISLLESGKNVAVVFAVDSAKLLPSSWKGYRVIDGTASDLRFLDDKNVVVGLPWKGPAGTAAYWQSLRTAKKSGFAVTV